MATNQTRENTLIACFFSGIRMPTHCTPMLREPIPNVGIPFDATFIDVLNQATRQNPAIHDGAVMVGRATPKETYQIRGWSFRLFPAEGANMALANRGSAFNSAHAMSSVPTIDATYWISGRSIYRFTEGRVYKLK